MPALALNAHSASGRVLKLSRRRPMVGVEAKHMISGRLGGGMEDGLNVKREFASETGPHAVSTPSPQVSLF